MSSNFDPRDLRRTFGQFPTGVTVITTQKDDGELVGCTASSFNSVSVDPPLVLWSVDKGGLGAETFKNAEYFAVNILSRDQIDLSNKFASRGEDKFSGVDWKPGKGGSPILKGCAAYFHCKTWSVNEGGDHWIIVGEVEQYERVESLSPLVFSQGSYSVAMQHPNGSGNKAMSNGEGTELGEYLLYLLRVSFSNSSASFYPLINAQFGITPEQWRMITLLSSNGEMSVADAAACTLQPIEAFKDAALLLENRGYLVLDGVSLALTKSGSELAEQLFAAARVHEKSLLASFSEDEIKALKNALSVIAKTNS